VLIDGVAFLIEGKAGGVRLASRRGAPAASQNDLKALVVEAHHQALRARRYIESAPFVVFSVGGQKVTIDRSRIREFFLVTVTLEILSAFVTRTYDLVETGLLKPGQLPWAIALPELEIITDLCDSAGSLIHYLRRRLRLGARRIAAAEELDWLGNYLQEGLFFDDEDRRSLDSIYVGDFAGPINAYYEGQHDPRLPAAPKPKQVLPVSLESLIADLEKGGPDGFVEAIAAILDGEGEARIRLSKGVEDASRKAKEAGWGGFRMVMADTVLVLSLSSSPTAPSFLEDYTRASKYMAKANRAIGISQVVQDHTGPSVVLNFSTWEDSEEAKGETDAFFAALKSRVERRPAPSIKG
jgi:hypothetical protein